MISMPTNNFPNPKTNISIPRKERSSKSVECPQAVVPLNPVTGPWKVLKQSHIVVSQAESVEMLELEDTALNVAVSVILHSARPACSSLLLTNREVSSSGC